MTASIFAAHGLEHKGNQGCEHVGVKNTIRKWYKHDHHHPMPLPDKVVRHLRSYVDSLDVDFWKGDAYYYPLWHHMNPKIVSIRRDLDAATASLRAKNHFAAAWDIDEVRRVQKMRYDYMDELIAKHGGVCVYTDELIAGNYTSLQEAFDYCGLEFKPEIATRVIDPTQWHFPSKVTVR